MSLTQIQGSGNEYQASSITDLNVENVTNLFNTGDPSTYSSLNHAGAVTVYIPQASLFNDGGGRYVNLGDFGFVQELAAGSLNISPGTYTIGQIQTMFSGQPGNGADRWSVVARQALIDQNSSDYVERAYIFNTQAYAIDQGSVITINQNGTFNFGNFEIRVDRDALGVMSEDFNFNGGDSSSLFNYLHADQIDDGNSAPVTLVYTGSGLTGSGYGNSDFNQWLSSTNSTNRASEGEALISFQTYQAYNRIVDYLKSTPVFETGLVAAFRNAAADYAGEVIDQNPDLLKDASFLSDLFNTLGRERAIQVLDGHSGACFGPQVMIDMWPLDTEFTPDPNNLNKVFDQDAVRAKVWKKPISLMKVGDWVVSFDKNENLVPGPVTRTMTNDVKILLDYFGTEVTPGHVYYRPDSKLPEKFETLIDVLRDDGIIQKQDGSHVRAATNVPVGDPLDGFVHTITGIRTANGTVEVKQRGRIRLGTRFIIHNGKERKSYSVADLISAGGGVVGDDELIRVGDSEPMEFHWEFSDTFPQPEDFVLACSGTTLEDIYAASEWEQMKPRLPAPTSRNSPDNANLGSTPVHIDFPNKLA